MRYGIVMPFGDAAEIADAAALAERSGWDALFAWEAVWGVDAWVALTAAAMRTSTLRLGTMLTPVPRIKPWDLASRVVTLDQLSGGRVTLGVGLGALHEGWTAFEPDEGRRVRVEQLDEVAGDLRRADGRPAVLLRGPPLHASAPTDFMVPDPPVQRPHPPVWLVGAWRVGATAAALAGAGGALAGMAAPGRRRRLAGQPAQPRRAGLDAGAVRAAREAAGLPWQGFDVCVEGELHGDDPLGPRRRRVAGGRRDLVGRERVGPGAHTRRAGGADPAGRRRPPTGMTAARTAGRRVPRGVRTSRRERLRGGSH